MNEFRLPMEYNWELAHKKIAKTEFYKVDYSVTNEVQVSTLKGIIEIENLTGNPAVPADAPDPGFASSLALYINNPKLLLTEANRDNIYVQITPYYKSALGDTFIPYILPSGVVTPTGLGLTIYNANPAVAGANQGEGKFYLYFELYTK